MTILTKATRSRRVSQDRLRDRHSLASMRVSVVLRCSAIALFGLMGVSSCGSSDGDSGEATTTSQSPTTERTSTSSTATTTTARAVSKAEYIATANAICGVMNDAVDALPDPADTAEAAITYEEAARIVSDTLEQLRALPPPPGDEESLDAIWVKVDELLEGYARFVAALRDDDQVLAQQISQDVEVTQNAANDASNAYGLTVCGS